MVKFRCKECSYTFETEVEKIPERCPYCNSKGSIAKEDSAEDLIGKL